MKKVLIDSGFWMALYSSKDQHHTQANNLVQYLDLANVIIPFPTLYEFVNTKFMGNNLAKMNFEMILQRDNVSLIDDESLKDDALRITFEENSKKRELSLVDNVIRLMLEDKNYKIDSLITFNEEDFFDICQKRDIEILYN
jgi:predicted nucleic acid-binding protein